MARKSPPKLTRRGKIVIALSILLCLLSFATAVVFLVLWITHTWIFAPSPKPPSLTLINAHSFNLTFFPAAQVAIPFTNWVYLLDLPRDCVHLWNVSSTGVWTDSMSCFPIYTPSYYLTPTFLSTSSDGTLLYVAYNQSTPIPLVAPLRVWGISAETGEITGLWTAALSPDEGTIERWYGTADGGIGIGLLTDGSGNPRINVYSDRSFHNTTAQITTSPYTPISPLYVDSRPTFYVILTGGISVEIIRSYTVSGTTLTLTLGDVSLFASSAASFTQLISDPIRERLLATGIGGIMQFDISLAAQPLQTASYLTPLVTSSCTAAYSQKYGSLYLPNGNTGVVQQFNQTVPLSPTSVPIPGGAIPAGTPCGMLEIGGYVSLFSADRHIVTTWKIMAPPS